MSDAASLPSGPGSGFGEKVLGKTGSQRVNPRAVWGVYQNSSRDKGQGNGTGANNSFKAGHSGKTVIFLDMKHHGSDLYL